MKILHTEASTGWGGQEIRILKEAEGMRQRGYEIFFVTSPGAQLAKRARLSGFSVEEVPMVWKATVQALWKLCKFIRKNKLDLIVTHSSMDAWLAGIAGRLTNIPIIRTRHLSTPIRSGWNSKLLYNHLADTTVTTCKEVARIIQKQATLSESRCFSVPTGVDPKSIVAELQDVEDFRNKWKLSPSDFVVGTVCVLRSWKGIADLLQAAKILKNEKEIKWLIVGGGSAENYFKEMANSLDVNQNVIFTGQLENPFPAMASMDVFTLLSSAHEGVSQSVLQAAFLKKPLITTPTGGLCEVCIHNQTGFLVDVNKPDDVAEYILKLRSNKELRNKFSQNAHQLVIENFTFQQTLDAMEKAYKSF
jgi:glycosyltransferase involved in cell wall biosynthesis